MSKRHALALSALVLAASLSGCAGTGTGTSHDVDELTERVEALEADAAMATATTTTTAAPGETSSSEPATSTTTTTTTTGVERIDPPINTVRTGSNDTADVSLQGATEQFTDWYPAGSAAITEVATAIEAVDSALERRSRNDLLDACYRLRDSAEAASHLSPIPDMVAQRYWSEGLANLAAATDWCYGTVEGDTEAATNLRAEIEGGLTSLRAVATTLG